MGSKLVKDRPDTKDKPKISNRKVEGVKFVCEDPPFSKIKPGTCEFYKDSTKDNGKEVVIGRLFGRKALSRKHALLKFEDSKVYISDAGSECGTWLENKGALKPNVRQELKDGVKIVFGAKEDKGSKADPEAVRVKVTLLHSRPKAPANKLDVPSTPPALKSSSSNSLKPPEQKHRRVVSFDLPKSHDRPSSSSSKNDKKDDEPSSTTLDTEIKIPWAETFRLGYGVNVLTGESTATCALKQFKPGPSLEPQKGETSIEVLHWDGLTASRDGYEIEVGGTINVACPVSMGVRVASVLSKEISTSTILVRYRQAGDSAMEFLPSNIALRQGLEKMSGREFRDRYGDYYIAGCQRSYSFNMIVVCRVDGDTVTDSHEKEAKLLVENFFKAGAKHEEVDSKTQNCSMLHVIIETFGCSADASRLTNGVVSVKDALKVLPKILNKPKGAPRVALLYHYSTLDDAKLPRQVSVPKKMFDQVHKMRTMYATLQANLLHPALQKYDQDLARFRSALKAFERKRTDLIQIQSTDNKNSLKRLEDSSIYRDLSSSTQRAATLLRRYEFIRSVKDMPKDYVRHVPVPALKAGDTHYRWECGKVNGKLKKKLSDYKHVTFESGYEAFEADWVSPVTSGSSTFKQILGLGSGHEEQMDFVRRDAESLVGRIEVPKGGADAVRVRSPDGAEPSFMFQLAGRRVYVIGWTLSCDWDGKKEPVIKVEDTNNFILRDYLSICLDTSHPAEWHCKVTFVFQSSYDFPDLHLQ